MFTLIFFLSQFFYASVFSQSNDIDRVEALFSLSTKESNNSNFEKSISLIRQALMLSKKIKYKKGIYKSYYFIAYDLCNIGKYDESFKYINILEKEYADAIEKDSVVNQFILDIKGRNFMALGFKNNAKIEFRKFLTLAERRNDKQQVYRDRMYVYVQLGVADVDSTYYYLCKTLTYRHKVKDPGDFNHIYACLSDYHIVETKNLDSAFYYNNESIRLQLKTDSTNLFAVYLQKSEILFQQKKYKESLKYAHISLQKSLKINSSTKILAAYKIIADNHHFLKNTEQELEYRNKYIHINDSLKTSQSLIKDNFTNKVIKEKDENISNNRIRFFTTLIFVIIFVFLVILWGLFSMKRLDKNKKVIINTKDKEVRDLYAKLEDTSFHEIMALAKSNSPNFLFRFKEIYPEFYKKLLELQPDLITSEILFCAFLKLNFSTKEIATYTFVTPKAVQNRKNRIRKRLNISSGIDIYDWINCL